MSSCFDSFVVLTYDPASLLFTLDLWVLGHLIKVVVQVRFGRNRLVLGRGEVLERVKVHGEVTVQILDRLLFVPLEAMVNNFFCSIFGWKNAIIPDEGQLWVDFVLPHDVHIPRIVNFCSRDLEFSAAFSLKDEICDKNSVY